MCKGRKPAQSTGLEQQVPEAQQGGWRGGEVEDGFWGSPREWGLCPEVERGRPPKDYSHETGTVKVILLTVRTWDMWSVSRLVMVRVLI